MTDASRWTAVAELGQSVWYDNVARPALADGHLARLVEQDAVTGGTSNPSIFAKAVLDSDLYDEQLARRPRRQRRRGLRALLDRGHPARLRSPAARVGAQRRARRLHLDRGGGRARLRGRARRGARARAARARRPPERDGQGAGHRRGRRGVPAPDARGAQHQHDAAVLARALPPDRRGLRRRADRAPGRRARTWARSRRSRASSSRGSTSRPTSACPRARRCAAARRWPTPSSPTRTCSSRPFGPALGAARRRRRRAAAAAVGLDRRQEPGLLAHALHRRADRRAARSRPCPTRRSTRSARPPSRRPAAPTVLDEIDRARAELAALADAGVDLDEITSALERDGVQQFGDAYAGMLEAIGRKRQRIAVP